MMEKVPKQQSVEIHPIHFQNGDHTNAQLENTGKKMFHNNPNTHYIVLYTQFQRQNNQLHLTCW